MDAVRSGFGQKMDLVEINVLAEDGFQAIEPLNLRFCMRLRGLGNLVGQMFTSWNPLTRWLRQIERLRTAM